MFKRTCFNPISCCPSAAFCRKRNASKKFLTELYENLAVEVLPSDNSENLQFDALTELCIKIGARLENSILANHQKARLNLKKQAKEISKT